MKLRDKLRKTSRKAMVARFCILLAIIYLLMVLIKTVYFASKGADFSLFQHLHLLASQAISISYVFPVDLAWENAKYIPFEGKPDVIEMYSVLAIPFVVIMVSAFFIGDHKALISKYYELRGQIQKEIDLREMRKDPGIETVPENASVDIVIDSAKNDDPAWHNTGWGKILIGVFIAAIVAAIGLK
ncbi:hypothetical protein [Vibrio splendidus]|uniref:hypothetical protein n=1 Tax=Vibrio splendidus TaxID=29497 RepID=UPI0021B1806A|nr:hypothetical protein [Vibrio splendidus]UWZ98601.1 hypothetical protein IM698_04405 [Vibrio splendidus]